MDTLIRYHRMKGKNTLWQVGTDHAGIATQMVVERQLAAENITRHDLGREKFLEKVWNWKRRIRWHHYPSTSPNGYQRGLDQRAVYNGRWAIRRGAGSVHSPLRGKSGLSRQAIGQLGPKLHTAISDLEVENSDEKGYLWHLRYPLENGATTSDGQTYLIVATTRPETMLGDTAVAVNPKDERYPESDW